jgi:hypothetical protein
MYNHSSDRSSKEVYVNETFLEIHKIAEGKVRAFLAENN